MAETSLDAFTAKDTRFVADWLKNKGLHKACTSFVLYLKVPKNNLYYLRHVRVLSIEPCLHTQLPEHNRSYWKVPRGWGHLITWNGPMMGHLNSFSASRGGIWTKIFQKFKCPGGCSWGGDVEASIWLVHNVYQHTNIFQFNLLTYCSCIWPVRKNAERWSNRHNRVNFF